MTRPAFALLLAVTAAGPVAAAPPAAFSTRIRPLLQTYCVKCHNADEAEGGVDYSAIKDDATALSKQKLWRRARNRVASGDMPPDDAPKRPTAAEKAELLAWLGSAADYLDCDPARRDPGPSLLRRLTRTEYQNTVRDLLGVTFDPRTEVGMPDDGGEGHFDNLAADLPLSAPLMDKYFTAADKIIEKLAGPDPGAVAARGRLAFAHPGPDLSERDAAARVLTQLVRRAYRRPAQPEDVNRLLGFFDRAKARGAGFDDAVRAGLKPVLVSPQFLFRVEEDRPAAGPGLGTPVDGHELAVRLSYFLWSSMPDDDLFRKAEDGSLADPAVFAAEVRRMLADPKAKALTENFAAQWLQLKKFATARPSAEFFPTFDGELKRAMAAEATEFLEHVRVTDRPVLDLLAADYTFANGRLAEHYGIPGVTGEAVRKVALKPEHHRGGVLAMGAVLALTSHTFRTSPTQRGKYVLEVIFGTPPPPPPANVPPLKDDAKGPKEQAVTVKDQLAQHAAQASCAGCHKKIDPLGFALDNYNAVGEWREGTPDDPLDVSGVLPGGVKVDGADDLKRVIVGRKDEFAKNFAAKLMEYAVGRELDGADECAVRDALAGLQKNDYRFSAAVAEVVNSVPFRQRRPAGK